MALPGLIAKGISQRTVPAEVHALIPVTVRRTLPVCGNVQKCEELPACVVENSVNHHFDVRFMTQGNEVFEAFIGSQTAVYRAVVPRVIPV